MNEPAREEEILRTFSPRGTWALLLVLVAGMALGWVALFVLFLSHGAVH
jgi:uncharacterized protein involved in exopolysaccharide biosynthesis